MTTPPTDPQLAALAAEVDKPGPHHFAKADVVAALDLITRLRTELAQARAAALREAADLLADRGYHLPADLVLRLPAQPPTPACSCRAEAVHQAGCDTDQHA